jgi:hypothetical protein
MLLLSMMESEPLEPEEPAIGLEQEAITNVKIARANQDTASLLVFIHFPPKPTARHKSNYYI